MEHLTLEEAKIYMTNDSHITWEGLTNKEAVTRRTFSTIRQVKIRNSDFKFDFVMVIICTSFELTRHFNALSSLLHQQFKL